MVDNFKLIRNLLEFRSKDDFFFVQVLQRKKDHKDTLKVNGSNNNSRLIKAYYVKSLDHFDFLEKEIKTLCKIFNARAGINLNRRSFEKMAFQHLKKCTDQIMNREFHKAHKAYPSVVGKFNNDSDKRWILDIDKEDNNKEMMNALKVYLDVMKPDGDKVVANIPSKTGTHLITRPFDKSKFNQAFPTIEIHCNNPTNLFIP